MTRLGSASQRLLPERVVGSIDDHRRLHGQLVLPAREQRAAVLDEVDRSGLLGRGGAGFPLGRKLRTVASGRSPAVVVANGCEGEPASAKDSTLMSAQPHLVLDGIALAAALVGADTAHLALHAGSPALAAVRAARAERSDDVRVQIAELPGRYVASEESALVHWLNGGEAKPTYTPPRPFEKGVAGRPTLINNVETLAQLALVVRHGADWYRQAGDPDEPGTLLLTVTGPDRAQRVVEVPTGATVKGALSQAGVIWAGVAAVLVGGYFGTWVTASEAAGLALTHRSMQARGGALGAGILVAIGHDTCGLAETARVMTYLAGENAGQCGPCLNGLPAVAGAFARLAHGPWDEGLGAALDRWLTVIPGRGACRHPDGALRMLASAFPAFAADVAVHRSGRPCRAAGAPGVLPVPAGYIRTWR